MESVKGIYFPVVTAFMVGNQGLNQFKVKIPAMLPGRNFFENLILKHSDHCIMEMDGWVSSHSAGSRL
jgi:hypothetical protein